MNLGSGALDIPKAMLHMYIVVEFSFTLRTILSKWIFLGFILNYSKDSWSKIEETHVYLMPRIPLNIANNRRTKQMSFIDLYNRLTYDGV